MAIAMQPTRRWILCILSLCVFLTCCGRSRGMQTELGASSPSVAFELNATKEKYRFEEPIIVRLSVANNGDEPIAVSGELMLRYCNFEILPTDDLQIGRMGQVIGDPIQGGQDLTFEIVRPGETLEREVDLQSLLSKQLPKDGKVRVTFDYVYSGDRTVEGVHALVGKVSSNARTFSISS